MLQGRRTKGIKGKRMW